MATTTLANCEAIGVVGIDECDQPDTVPRTAVEDPLAESIAFRLSGIVPDEVRVVDEGGVTQGLMHGSRSK